MGDIAMIGAGVLGNVAGAKTASVVGNWLNGGSNSGGDPNAATAAYVNGTVSNMNNILGTALKSAMGSSTDYTNQAIGQQNTSLQNATNAFTGALNSGNQAIQQGLAQSQAMSAPYSNAGLSALDSYQDSLGLKRAAVGSQVLSQAQQQVAALQPTLASLQQASQAANWANPYAPFTAPVLQQAAAPTIGPAPDWSTYLGNAYNNAYGASTQEQAEYAAHQSYNTDMQKYSAAQQAQQAQQAQLQAIYQNTYDKQQGLFNAQTAAQNQLNGINPQLLQIGLAARRGLFQR